MTWFISRSFIFHSLSLHHCFPLPVHLMKWQEAIVVKFISSPAAHFSFDPFFNRFSRLYCSTKILISTSQKSQMIGNLMLSNDDYRPSCHMKSNAFLNAMMNQNNNRNCVYCRALLQLRATVSRLFVHSFNLFSKHSALLF